MGKFYYCTYTMRNALHNTVLYVTLPISSITTLFIPLRLKKVTLYNFAF